MSGYIILPFYLVCDESASLHGRPIDSLNAALADFHSSVLDDPIAAETVRFSLIGFSSDARVLIPLSDLRLVNNIPLLMAHGLTNYGAAFELLRQAIDADLSNLGRQGNRILRPVIFFVSDGQPTDSWQESYDRLTDQSWRFHPHIVAFGLGSADKTLMASIATVRAFVASPSMAQADVFRELGGILSSFVASTGASVGTKSTLMIPIHAPGFTPVELA